MHKYKYINTIRQEEDPKVFLWHKKFFSLYLLHILAFISLKQTIKHNRSRYIFTHTYLYKYIYIYTCIIYMLISMRMSENM